MINLKALDDAIAWADREQVGQHVEGEPVWLQTRWMQVNECGTACCIAGRVALNAGYVPLEIGDDGDVMLMHNPETGHQDSPDDIAYGIILGDYAVDYGSKPYQALVELTDGSNSLSDIRTARGALGRLVDSGW